MKINSTLKEHSRVQRDGFIKKKKKNVQSGSSLNMRSNLYFIPGESFDTTSGVCNLCLVRSFLI